MNFQQLQDNALSQWEALQKGERPRILLGMGTCGIAAGAEDVLKALTGNEAGYAQYLLRKSNPGDYITGG